MSSDELTQVIEKLNDMEQRMATKDDINNMATKSDISNMATKDDISNMATKDDISNMATKDDISNMATKYDISNMASKDDIDELRQEMNSRFDEVNEDLGVIREQVAHNSEFEPVIKHIQKQVRKHESDLTLIKNQIT